MLSERLAKYINNDNIERYKVEFLKEIVDKTEKGEFNCCLCHTLNRLFALAKNPNMLSRDAASKAVMMPILSKVQS